jgi:hypothetical protein
MSVEVRLRSPQWGGRDANPRLRDYENRLLHLARALIAIPLVVDALSLRKYIGSGA